MIDIAQFSELEFCKKKTAFANGRIQNPPIEIRNSELGIRNYFSLCIALNFAEDEFLPYTANVRNKNYALI